jgi:hypothetical protein
MDFLLTDLRFINSTMADQLSALQAENQMLKEQLTRYYAANCSVSQQLMYAQAEVYRLTQLTETIFLRNKQVEAAIKTAVFMIPFHKDDV